MKKYITYLIAVLILSLSLCFPVSAEQQTVSFSDDFYILYYDHVYSRFDASALNFELESVNWQVTLTSEQQESVQRVELMTDETQAIIYAEIRYYDGSELIVHYLRDNCFAEYQELMDGTEGNYSVDFFWPEGNIVEHESEDFYGDRVTISSTIVDWSDWYTVYAKSESGTLAMIKGELLINGGDYYFLSFDENNLKNQDDLFSGLYDEFTVWEIQDGDLLDKIEEAETAYYGEDVGFLYDDELGEVITAVAMILLFAVLPFGLLITFLILAIRAKGLYRKLFAAISILCAVEVSVFSIVALIISIL